MTSVHLIALWHMGGAIGRIRPRLVSVIRLAHCVMQYICRDFRFDLHRHGHLASTESEDRHAHGAP
jgi:hypothetical protein